MWLYNVKVVPLRLVQFAAFNVTVCAMTLGVIARASIPSVKPEEWIQG